MPPQKFQTTERANEDAEEKTAATTACVHAKPDEQGDFDHQDLQAHGEQGPQIPPGTAVWGSVFQ